MKPYILCEKPSILHIPSNQEPLSSDVFLIPEDKMTWIFDLGALSENAESIAKIPGEKYLVLSHFHRDHTQNLLTEDLSTLGIQKIYATEYTIAHLHCPELLQKAEVEIIKEKTPVSDIVTLIPLRSSHAKGCLGLLLEESYFFLGDAIYGMPKNGESVYNAQLLLEEIRQLSDIPAEYFCPSHRSNPLCKKDGILTFLESVYVKREKNVPTIIL